MTGRIARTAIVLLVFLVYLAVAVLATYPLVKNIDRSVPFDLGDPLFMSWLVSWNDGWFLSPGGSLAGLFNTNIYYPYENTLAYSDLMLVPSLLVLPVYYITRNPIVTVNALLLLELAGTALAFFLLARYLTKNTSAALIGGFLYAFSTYHLAQIGHVQLHADAFLLLMLLFLHIWLDGRRSRHLVLAFFMLWLQALSSWYYAIYGAMAASIFIGYFLLFRGIRLDRRRAAAFALTLVVFALAVYPFVSPYLQLNRSMPAFERNFAETAFYAADLSDYVMTVPQTWLWGRLIGLAKPGVEDILWPGLAVIILAFIAVKGLAQKVAKREPEGQIKLYYLILSWSAFVLSLGPYKNFFGRVVPLPFIMPFALVPGFKAMRVPARFGLLVLLGLSVLATYTLAWLLSVWRDRRADTTAGTPAPRLSFRPVDVWGALVLVLIVIQQISWPIPLSPPIPSGNRIPPIYKWLASYRGADVIIELPPIQGEQVKYVYFSAYHTKRLVNGYSGYTPPLWTALESKLADFPAAGTVRELRRLGVDGVLVHADLIPGWTERPGPADIKGLRLVKQINGDYFFLITGPKRPQPRGLPQTKRRL